MIGGLVDAAVPPAVRCPGCNCLTRELALERPVRLAQCEVCGLAFRVSENVDPAHYDAGYFAGEGCDGGYADYLGAAAQWRHEARLRLQWLASEAGGGRLLEVGCAAGFFLEAAAAAGFSCQAVEVSAAMAEHVRTRLGVPVHQAAFEDVSLRAGSFDAVCAFHVLEHTTRPQEFLRAALALLRPGGLLALEVPNFAGRHARRAGASWIGLQPRYHALQFSTRSLRALLERVGFEPLSVETFWHQGYELPTERRRLRSLAVRGARALRTRRLGPVHPSEGDYVRALALRPARPGSTST